MITFATDKKVGEKNDLHRTTKTEVLRYRNIKIT